LNYFVHNNNNNKKNRHDNPTRKDRYNYSKEEIQEGKFLGKGNFGTVYECRLPSKLGIYALKKVVYPDHDSDFRQRRILALSFIMELEALKQVSKLNCEVICS